MKKESAETSFVLAGQNDLAHRPAAESAIEEQNKSDSGGFGAAPCSPGFERGKLKEALSRVAKVAKERGVLFAEPTDDNINGIIENNRAD